MNQIPESNAKCPKFERIQVKTTDVFKDRDNFYCPWFSLSTRFQKAVQSDQSLRKLKWRLQTSSLIVVIWWSVILSFNKIPENNAKCPAFKKVEVKTTGVFADRDNFDAPWLYPRIILTRTTKSLIFGDLKERPRATVRTMKPFMRRDGGS